MTFCLPLTTYVLTLAVAGNLYNSLSVRVYVRHVEGGWLPGASVKGFYAISLLLETCEHLFSYL